LVVATSRGRSSLPRIVMGEGRLACRQRGSDARRRRPAHGPQAPAGCSRAKLAIVPLVLQLQFERVRDWARVVEQLAEADGPAHAGQARPAVGTECAVAKHARHVRELLRTCAEDTIAIAIADYAWVNDGRQWCDRPTPKVRMRCTVSSISESMSKQHCDGLRWRKIWTYSHRWCCRSAPGAGHRRCNGTQAAFAQ
jgi:hypothetical protein